MAGDIQTIKLVPDSPSDKPLSDEDKELLNQFFHYFEEQDRHPSLFSQIKSYFTGTRHKHRVFKKDQPNTFDFRENGRVVKKTIQLNRDSLRWSVVRPATLLRKKTYRYGVVGDDTPGEKVGEGSFGPVYRILATIKHKQNKLEIREHKPEKKHKLGLFFIIFIMSTSNILH